MSDRPARLVENEPLDTYTTVRAGGAAEFFSRCGNPEELHSALSWAADEGLELNVLGSGSNLLVADEGVEGLVVKLDGKLAAIEVDAVTGAILCGGGARLPSVAAKAAAAGLAGLEFGVSIPGTVGGAVRMNANAYGGDLAESLSWAEVIGPRGIERRPPESLGFAYRRSNLARGEVVSQAAFHLSPADPAASKAVLAELRAKRKEAQPWGVKTFGSTFKNPTGTEAEGRSAGQLLDGAGCRDLRVGGAGFSEKHANFVINHGTATTADVVELMGEGRRRVEEKYGVTLEPEVQTLGPVPIPPEWRGSAS